VRETVLERQKMTKERQNSLKLRSFAKNSYEYIKKGM
jgi:hypothetical protein